MLAGSLFQKFSFFTDCLCILLLLNNSGLNAAGMWLCDRVGILTSMRDVILFSLVQSSVYNVHTYKMLDVFSSSAFDHRCSCTPGVTHIILE